MRNWSLVLCACALTIVGCGEPEPMTGTDAGTRDSGTAGDSSMPPDDSSMPPEDASTMMDDASTMMDDASAMMDDASMGDAGPEASAFEADVWPILQARCVFCHASGSGMLTFTDAATAHAALVGPDRARGTGMCTEAEAPLERVTPGDPEASFLFVKVSGTPPEGCGSRMPLSGGPLTAAQVETIRSWIAAGAMND